MENNNYLGKKRNYAEYINKDISSPNINNINNEDSSNSTPKTNQDSIGNEELINDNKLYNEGVTLDVHKHWVNKVLILQKQPKHNLMSSSADGKIIIFSGYPDFNPILIMSLFGESGVTHLTELKNGTIIACSFGALKQIILNYNNLNNKYEYEVINYFVICTTYISKCIELNNEDLLFISQQNSIIILEKVKNNNENKENNKIQDIFIMKAPIKLLNYEICINILQLKDDLYISGSITDTKYNILVKGSKKVNANFVNFYNDKFETIFKFKNMYLTKSQENIVKIDNQFVAVGIEMCLNEVNWNNNKGIAIINYNYFQLITFYEVDNQISSILLHEKYLFIGDNKGYVSKYKFIDNEMILQKSKRVHFYNINSITCNNIYEKDLNQNTFLIFTGSNDNKIKITSYFKD